MSLSSTVLRFSSLCCETRISHGAHGHSGTKSTCFGYELPIFKTFVCTELPSFHLFGLMCLACVLRSSFMGLIKRSHVLYEELGTEGGMVFRAGRNESSRDESGRRKRNGSVGGNGGRYRGCVDR